MSRLGRPKDFVIDHPLSRLHCRRLGLNQRRIILLLFSSAKFYISVIDVFNMLTMIVVIDFGLVVLVSAVSLVEAQAAATVQGGIPYPKR